MPQVNFEKLRVYKESLKLVNLIYETSKTLPKSERFALTDQLKRAVISIPLNIAEGQGRKSDKERKQFLMISRGSLYETLAIIDIAYQQKYISSKTRQNTRKKIFNLLRQLNSLINYLSK